MSDLSTEVKCFIPKDYKPKSWAAMTLTDFELGMKLGEGTFGRVFEARYKATKVVVAIKLIDIETTKKHGDEDYVNDEIIIQTSLQHENIVGIFGTFSDINDIALVMEFCPNGNLEDQLRTLKRFPERRAADITRDVASGLQFMHGKKIIHRDIKLENIMIASKGNPKIGDFGLALDLNLRKNTYEIVGTFSNHPPEMFKSPTVYSFEIDIWALGIVLYRILTGQRPFEGRTREELALSIMAALTFPAELEISAEAKAVVGMMLTKRRGQRAKLSTIMAHSWVTPTS